MAFWKADIETRDGAENAARSGSYACFIVAAASVLYAGLQFALPGTSDAGPLANVIGILAEAAIILVAGLRLRSGKGAYWGIAAVALLGMELVAKLAALSVGSAVTALFLVVVLNGVRGAWALRRDTFPDDLADLFD